MHSYLAPISPLFKWVGRKPKFGSMISGVIQESSYPQWTTIIFIHCYFTRFYFTGFTPLGLAGLWGGIHGPWVSCIYCCLALLGNLCWTYWLARGPHATFDKTLARSRFQLPEHPPNNMLEWALILRLTPGVPFILQIIPWVCLV